MKGILHIKGVAQKLFFLTVALFAVFFIYMNAAERVSVTQAEPPRSYSVISSEVTLVNDETAPVGVRKVYEIAAQDGTLCFNIAHHEIRVWLDGEPIYTLVGAESNRVAKNVSSNWCYLDFDREDVGKTITVELTPLFSDAMGKNPEFWMGDHFAMASGLVRQELVSMMLSALCILLGLFVLGVYIYFRFFTRTKTAATSYLGIFSMALGLWKLTDLRSMTLLMPEYALALGYISVGSLFLTGVSLMLHFSTLFYEERRKLPLALSCVGSVVCLAILAMQVFGFGEIRQNLIYSHILLIAAVALVPVAALLNRIFCKEWGVRRSWRLLLLILLGISVDLLGFYRHNNTSTVSFSVVGFIVYLMVVFFGSILDSSRNAYTDSHTGLVNRTRWNEMLRGDIQLPKSYAMLVLDLNGLKRVNDTLGHEAGDLMIFRLSSILRNTLPRTSLICRWGGDEFTAVLPDVDRTKLEYWLQKLISATESYNSATPDLPIHFAIGAALSTEHPELSAEALFRFADEEMYKNKRSLYADR